MQTQKIYGGEQHGTVYNVMHHHTKKLKSNQTITHFLYSQTSVYIQIVNNRHFAVFQAWMIGFNLASFFITMSHL